MEIKTERNYHDFAANILHIKSVVTDAIQTNKLVDAQFSTIQKWGVRWIFLTLLQPFYALSGKDAFMHVRVDAVARSVLTYCQLNNMFLKPALEQEISDEILGRLNVKTHSKYRYALNAIAESILRTTETVEAFWEKERTRLETEGISEALLAAHFKSLQEAVEAEQIAPDIAAQIRKKCWDFSLDLADPALAFKACATCQQYDDVESLSLVFRSGETFTMPEYYAQILAKQSAYFKKLFEGGFKEGGSSEVHLPKIRRSHFVNIVNALKHGKLELEDYDITDAVNFTKLVERLQLPTLHAQSLEIVANALSELPLDEEHVALVEELENVPYLPAIAKGYYEKYAQSIANKPFDKLLAFLQKHGQKLSSLTLKNSTGDDLSKQLACCPNLTSLDISGSHFNRYDDLPRLVACPKLESLNLENCLFYKFVKKSYLFPKILTNLEALRKLPCLKYLNLRYCGYIQSEDDLLVLKEQFDKDLVVDFYFREEIPGDPYALDTVKQLGMIIGHSVKVTKEYLAAYSAGKRGVAPPLFTDEDCQKGYKRGMKARTKG